MARLRGLVVLCTLLAIAAVASAETRAEPTPGRAVAVGIKVQLPNQPSIVSGAFSAPPSAAASAGAFAYPADGSLISAGTVTGRAAAGSGSARAGSDITHVSLLGGEVTADAVIARASATGSTGSASGDFVGSGITNLVVLGQPITPSPNLRIPIGDWGHAVLLEQQVVPDASGATPRYRGWVTALDVWLDADHGAFPVGTRVLVGYADAAAEGSPAPEPPETSQVESTTPLTTEPAPTPTDATAPATTTASPPPPPPAATTSTPQRPKTPPTPPAARQPTAQPDSPVADRQAPDRPVATTPAADLPVPPEPKVTAGLRTRPVIPNTRRIVPRLTAGGYVFPVYGASGYGDTFGAARADVSWHHGDDIFAPLGAPLLAVADGTVFSVGWNRIGGNRLWLRDRYGNQFYYAHLSAFSPLALNGARVRAGDVLGFVGNTGDAVGTPYHLHFEIHPVSMLFMDYDGVVNPTPYLDAWKRVSDLRFPAAGGAWAPVATSRGRRAPAPGAILLQATDISTASGLDPRSLERALVPVSAEGDGALIGFAGIAEIDRERGSIARRATG